MLSVYFMWAKETGEKRVVIFFSENKRMYNGVQIHIFGGVHTYKWQYNLDTIKIRTAI